MQRSFDTYLWDMHEAGMHILEATQGKSFTDYSADHVLRRAVERNFEIIGEAITQCRKLYPAEKLQISDASEIVAFRNKVTHGYFTVVDRVVWSIVENDLPLFLAEVTVLLDEWHQG